MLPVQYPEPYDFSPCWYQVDGLNKGGWINITGDPGFIGGGTAPDLVDFGLKPDSRIYKIRPQFKSCPRSQVGPKPVPQGTVLPLYADYWNVDEPVAYQPVMWFSSGMLGDQSKTVPWSQLEVQTTSRDLW